MRINRSTYSKRNLAKSVSFAILAVAMVIVALFAVDKYSNFDIPLIGTPKNSFENGVNYRPPTDNELREVDEHKKSLGDDTPGDEQQHTSSQQKIPVVVTLVSWGQDSSTQAVDATGSVEGEISSSGTCTLRMTKGATTVRESRQSTANSQNTSCGRILIPYSKLTPGTWELQIDYSSATAEGTSATIKQEVR